MRDKKMRVIKRGVLGRFAGRGSKGMPSNGETFIDARLISRRLHKTYPDSFPASRTHWNNLVTSCWNCGDYSHISENPAIEYLQFLGYTVTRSTIGPINYKKGLTQVAACQLCSKDISL